MKPLEELLQENKELADKRTKAFRELKKMLCYKTIPALAECMEKVDIERCYFRLENKPYEGFDKHSGECKMDFYYISIDDDGDIKEATYDEYTGKWAICNTPFIKGEEIGKIKNNCVIEFTQEILKKIENINKRMEKTNAEVYELLK